MNSEQFIFLQSKIFDRLDGVILSRISFIWEDFHQRKYHQELGDYLVDSFYGSTYACDKEKNIIALVLNKVKEQLTFLQSFPTLKYLCIDKIKIEANSQSKTIYLRDFSFLPYLVNLEVLSACCCFIDSAQLHFINQAPSLKYLDLSENKIEKLQLSADFEYLEALYVNCNEIKEVNIGAMPTLRVLSLHTNKIERLYFLVGLDALEQFYGQENNIQGDVVIGNMPCLQHLDLTKNKINSLHFYNCPQLEVLELGENPLNSLTIFNCPKLQILNLSDTKIKYINIDSSVKLTHLNLSRCGISDVDIDLLISALDFIDTEIQLLSFSNALQKAKDDYEKKGKKMFYFEINEVRKLKEKFFLNKKLGKHLLMFKDILLSNFDTDNKFDIYLYLLLEKVLLCHEKKMQLLINGSNLIENFDLSNVHTLDISYNAIFNHSYFKKFENIKLSLLMVPEYWFLSYLWRFFL